MLQRKKSCFLCQAFFFLWETAVVAFACLEAVLSVCLKRGGIRFFPIYRQNHLVSPPLFLYCFQSNALAKSLLKIQMLKVSHIKRNAIQKWLILPLFFVLDYFCGELEQDGPLFSLLKVGSISSPLLIE